MVVAACLCAFCLLAISHLMTRPENFARQIQNEISKVEEKVSALIESNPEVGQYGKNDLGVFVYNNDSLLYWNDNAIGPRIIRRKVAPNNDTICNLLTGDYYVKSFSKGQITFYVFRQINTTYKLNNRYFENRFVLNNPLINDEVRFGSAEGYEIKSSSGKVLSRC